MSKTDYFAELLSEEFNIHNIQVPRETIKLIADSVRIGVENMDMAFPKPDMRGYEDGEISRLREELKKERAKRVCPDCKGIGEVSTQGPYHSCTSTCYKCRGEGKK